MHVQNPRDYPDAMPSPESGRPMARGEKEVTFTVQGRSFTYMQPGWWCSLSDPADTEGQLVDEHNQVAEMARRSAKALAGGEPIFVPVVTQCEAGALFGSDDKSFDKYESGEIKRSEPTKRLLKLAMERPELFRKAEPGEQALASADDATLIRQTLRAASVERFYERLFTGLDGGGPAAAP